MVPASPITVRSTGNKRRTVQTATTPKCHKKLHSEGTRTGSKQAREKKRGETSRPVTSGAQSHSSDNVPLSRMIPKVPRRRSDFQDPATPPHPLLSDRKLELSGLGNPRTVRRLKEISRKFRPDIMFLIETKNPNDFVLRKCDQLGYEEHHLVPPTGHGAGGLALL